MAQGSGKPQVRLEPDVESIVLDEVERIYNEEATDLSIAQAANRMLREWRKARPVSQTKAARR